MIESHLYADDGHTPNNPHLPLVIIRRSAAADAEDPAAWFEEQFTSHDWGACWRWVIYPFHHFHTTNHEVLGVSRGHAKLMLGGEKGGEFDVDVGDVIVIPAGVGHQCIHASSDFQVVGAYPSGKEPDLIRSDDRSADLDAARRRIGQVPIPAQDPIEGFHGRLFEHWR